MPFKAFSAEPSYVKFTDWNSILSLNDLIVFEFFIVLVFRGVSSIEKFFLQKLILPEFVHLHYQVFWLVEA